MEKIQSLSQQITLMLSRDCQCLIGAEYITAAQLSCDPQEITHVIYKARLSSTPDVSSADLISLLQEQVTSESTSVTLEHIQLSVDASCTVMINSLNDPICPLLTTTPEVQNTPTVDAEESSSNLTVYIIATLAVVAFTMILIVVSIIASFIIYQRKSSKRYNLRLVKSYSLSVQTMITCLCRSRQQAEQPLRERDLQKHELRDHDHYEELPSLSPQNAENKSLEADEKAESSPSASVPNHYEPLDFVNANFKPHDEDTVQGQDATTDDSVEKVDLTNL